jgi:hypothetical protein
LVIRPRQCGWDASALNEAFEQDRLGRLGEAAVWHSDHQVARRDRRREQSGEKSG